MFLAMTGTKNDPLIDQIFYFFFIYTGHFGNIGYRQIFE